MAGCQLRRGARGGFAAAMLGADLNLSPAQWVPVVGDEPEGGSLRGCCVAACSQGAAVGQLQRCKLSCRNFSVSPSGFELGLLQAVQLLVPEDKTSAWAGLELDWSLLGHQLPRCCV